MQKKINIYYISGNTSILARDMGRAFMSQFPEVEFTEEALPFIRSLEDARFALEKIISPSEGEKPIVISSLVDEELNEFFNRDGINFFTIFGQYLPQFEKILGQKASRLPGSSRMQDDTALASRVSAIHYSIAHDDGTGISDYDEAELILLGVSRSGKTPVSIFMATQLGIKTANHPLVPNDLSLCHLPPAIRRNRNKVIGLSIAPDVLQKFRQSRLPGTRYAELDTCTRELKQAHLIYEKYHIPVVFSGGSSIEETAMQVFKSRQKL